MKKQINVKELIPGMHLSKICGSWIDHPFWKTEFILTQQDIKLLHESNITEVWINLQKGLHPVDNLPSPNKNIIEPNKNNRNSAITVTEQEIKPSDNIFPNKTSFKQEIKKAKNIVKNAGAVVQSMFNDIRMGKAFNENDAIALVDEISESVFKNSDALISIARLKNKDNYTYLHSVAVCALMVSLAKTLGYVERTPA